MRKCVQPRQRRAKVTFHVPSDFNEMEIDHIVEHLRHIPSAEKYIALLEEIKPQLSQISADMHQPVFGIRMNMAMKYGHVLAMDINVFYDLGRALLKRRELDKAGKTQEEIEAFISSWERPNLF